MVHWDKPSLSNIGSLLLLAFMLNILFLYTLWKWLIIVFTFLAWLTKHHPAEATVRFRFVQLGLLLATTYLFPLISYISSSIKALKNQILHNHNTFSLFQTSLIPPFALTKAASSITLNSILQSSLHTGKNQNSSLFFFWSHIMPTLNS